MKVKVFIAIPLLAALGYAEARYYRDETLHRHRRYGQPTRVKREDTGQSAEEVVDVTFGEAENEKVQMNFNSHGRAHKLNLWDTGKSLADIPVQVSGVKKEELAEARNELKHIKLMRNDKYGASVAMKIHPDGEAQPILQSAAFKLGRHEFHMTKHTDGKAKIVKRAAGDLEFGSSRSSRSIALATDPVVASVIVNPISTTVELLIISDYSMWMRFSSSGSATPLLDLMLFLAHIVEMADTAYSSIKNDDIAISVKLAGFWIITDDTTVPFLVEANKFPLGGGEFGVDGIAVHDNLTGLLDGALGDTLPDHDHFMLFTNYDIHEGTTEQFRLGYSWIASICNQTFSCSVVEARGSITSVALTATHELGHSLGADHDGEFSSFECIPDGYIMSSYITEEDQGVNSNIFLFSCCAQRSFYVYANLPTSTCLTTMSAVPNYNATVDTRVANTLPGRRYDADDQCHMAFETSACATQTNICLELLCVDPADAGLCVSTRAPAADGTACGAGMYCQQSQCIDDDSMFTLPDQHCDVRDCYGYEVRCNNSVNIYPPTLGMFQCYPQHFACDDFVDCGDNSDEENCPENEVCGDEPTFLNGTWGKIASPLYPEDYPNNARCVWIITVQQFARVQIMFLKTSTVEFEHTCAYDFIEVYLDVDTSEQLCGEILQGTKYVSLRNELYLLFLTDSSIVEAGWLVRWNAVCDDNLNFPPCTTICTDCRPPLTPAQDANCRNMCIEHGRECCSSCCRFFPDLCEIPTTPSNSTQQE